MTPDLLAFITAIVYGMLLMMLWDLFHGLRTVFFKSVNMNFLLDSCWWMISAFSIVIFTWYTNGMNLRFYIYFGLAGGSFLYYITLSQLFRRLFCIIFNIILKIIRFIFKILLTPAVFLYKILLVSIIKKITVFFRKAGNYAAIKKQDFRFYKKK